MYLIEFYRVENLLTEKERNTYLKKLGKRLRELREKKGYTNYEFFAYDFGISRTQYGKYEAGGNIQFDTLLKRVI